MASSHCTLPTLGMQCVLGCVSFSSAQHCGWALSLCLGKAAGLRRRRPALQVSSWALRVTGYVLGYERGGPKGGPHPPGFLQQLWSHCTVSGTVVELLKLPLVPVIVMM